MQHPGPPEPIKVPATRGRPFAPGNAGRKPGSKNGTTLVASALLEGEAEELVRKAVELAKAGDVAMLKFLLDQSCRGSGRSSSIYHPWILPTMQSRLWAASCAPCQRER